MKGTGRTYRSCVSLSWGISPAAPGGWCKWRRMERRIRRCCEDTAEREEERGNNEAGSGRKGFSSVVIDRKHAAEFEIDWHFHEKGDIYLICQGTVVGHLISWPLSDGAVIVSQQSGNTTPFFFPLQLWTLKRELKKWLWVARCTLYMYLLGLLTAEQTVSALLYHYRTLASYNASLRKQTSDAKHISL